MKKSLTLLFFVIILFNTTGQSQSQGFSQSECGIVSNSSYYFENNQAGSHGWGYGLFHNGVLIAGESNSIGGFSGEDLRFIDDTTGFFVVNEIGYGFEVYKIIGDSVIKIGRSGGYHFDLFVVSRHTVYFSTDVYPEFNILFINRLSDIREQKVLIYDTTMLSDSSFMDTVLGIPFCSGLNELDYLFHSSVGILTYKIRFHLDSLNSIPIPKAPKLIAYPNPAADFIRIDSYNMDHDVVNILDNMGNIRKSFLMKDLVKPEIYIGDLKNGVYFIVINNKQTTFVYKLIKI